MFRSIGLFLLLATVATGSPEMLRSQEQGVGEPLFVVHRQPSIPLVTLRMSLLVDDPPGLAGAGHLIQHLHHANLRSQAQVVGAQVRMERTADAVVYSITGPAAELHFLGRILRSTLLPPTAGAGARLTAERELAEERLAEWETAERHVRAALRGRLFPNDISAAGSPSSARRLASESLDEVWARMYRPDRITILAVGDVSLQDVREEFSDLPPQPEIDPATEIRDTVSLIPLAPAQATRGWLGAGYRAEDFDPAAVSVTARLLSNALAAQLPRSESVGEHWWTHHGQALILVVAAPPTELAAAPQRLRSVAADLLEDVADRHVSAAARAIRRDMLFYSRTPDRMAELLGQFVDRGGDASSAQEFYANLEAVDAVSVRDVLRHLTRSPAAYVAIPPQELNVSR